MTILRIRENLLNAFALAILSKRVPVVVAVVAATMFGSYPDLERPSENSVVKADLVQTGEYARYQELASNLCGDADRTILLATSETTSLLTPRLGVIERLPVRWSRYRRLSVSIASRIFLGSPGVV